MDDIVISVENLSKKYDLGVIGTGTFSKDLNRWWARMRHKPDPYAKIGELDHGNRLGQTILALDDVSFTVKRGEVLGIIGRNGAGKSTLLKILSQVTAPSSGKVKIKGRIGSLLEVGTGFHPELTGRENLYLNGAILGMSKAEVNRKFDEIVDFSGVEKFIDTPVKRYSSGMYVRLAFAVAAHLEPEILIVDEVLAVGDAEFQKKCLGKMSDVAHEGRTVLFVSHNMGAIGQLCKTAMVLQSGQVAFQGETDAAVSIYLEKLKSRSSSLQRDRSKLSDANQFITIYNADSTNQPRDEFRHDEEIRIIFEVYLPEWHDMLEVCLIPCNKIGERICVIDIPLRKYYSGKSIIKFSVTLPSQFLVPGFYSWIVFIHHPHVMLYDNQDRISQFSILETGSIYARYAGFEFGTVYPPDYKIDVL